MWWFWSGFWPNLAATLVGIILGVPTALWLNRYVGRAAERNRRADESERLKNGLAVIRAALAHNRPKLLLIDQILRLDKASFDVGLDIVAWDACKDEIVPFLKSPDLQRRIALHFGHLGTTTRLFVLYLDQVAGMTSTLVGIETIRRTLKNHLLAACQELLKESERLDAEIEGVKPATLP